ncbi:MAG: insulinase family protein [candidate division Zixibacteria bacterium]
MNFKTKLPAITTIILILLSINVFADNWLEGLQEDGTYNNFIAETVYLDAKDKAAGARLIHKKSGFTVDLFQIQSQPQAFLWVNSDHFNDQGEPHSCEHLLLGKGTKGRYVASLENMSLGRRTAWTGQIYTCYPFSSGGGSDAFYMLFKEKLDALLNPTFSDEEIRREVYNIGVEIDESTGQLFLEEKGTIHAEMISYDEKYWNHFYDVVNGMIYGESHPLAISEGGTPEAIRNMTAADMRTFHEKYYQLNNMGAVIAFPGTVSAEEFLERVNVILSDLGSEYSEPGTRQIQKLPNPEPNFTPGEIRITRYPGASEQDPGYIMYAWPANLELTLEEKFLLDAFLDGLANGQTSNLYNKFINSDTRVMDIGANGVWGGADDYIGHSVSVGFTNVSPENINNSTISTIKRHIIEEIAAVAAYQSGSDELSEFNNRVKSNLVQSKKSAANMLNSPPGFGQRSGRGYWYDVVKDLEKYPGFKISLVYNDLFDYGFNQIEKNENIWKSIIEKARLINVDPIAVGCRADPTLLEKAANAKKERLTAFAQNLKNKYNTDNEQEALVKFKEDYDRDTKIIDDEMAKIPMPKFIDNPPLSLDPQLDYQVETLSENVPLVFSKFNNITSATFGIAFNLRVIPRDKLIYLPLIPSLIGDIGVIKDGESISYESLTDKLKNEVLSLNGSFSSNPISGRVELLITGAGSNIDESENALGWIITGLLNPYLESDNLSRIRDVVINNLTSLRRRTQTFEEYWVFSPANGYKYQRDHLYMTASCFLTQEHFMHQLKWRLKNPGNTNTIQSVQELFTSLASAGESSSKEDLIDFASTFSTGDPARFESGLFGQFVETYMLSPVEAQDIIQDALSDMATILSHVPPENAAQEWIYLANQMNNDLLFRPEKVLSDLKETLALIRNRNTARTYLISNSEDKEKLLPVVEDLIACLDDRAPIFPTYDNSPAVWDRMKSRYPDLTNPVYAGLVIKDSRNGVFIYRAEGADYNTVDEEKLLDFLTAKLYGGTGSHSLFMKTWSAGLAYSNGLQSSISFQQTSYYAERCPDLATTMRFVVNELKNATYDPQLAEYAIAQPFLVNRGANSYQSRGRAMASNLADGITPDVVIAFRERILELRKRENLYDILHARLEKVCGTVLIGYGPALSEINGSFFVIGPDAQFESLDKYISETEGKQEIYKIYARDYWLVN